MAEINIQNELSQEINPFQISKVNSNSSTTPSVLQLDSLASVKGISTDATLNMSSSLPQLTSPLKGNTSLLAFFSAIGLSKLSFDQQLNQSEFMDQLKRSPEQQDKQDVLQAQILQNLIDNREAAAAQNLQNYQTYSDSLNALANSAPDETKTMNQTLMTVNHSADVKNAATQAKTISQSYKTYLNKIQALGVVSSGNGTYFVPSASVNQYNKLTSNYNNEVNSYNSFVQNLNLTLNNYNSTANTYNQQVDSDNHDLNSILNSTQYDFASAITQGNFPSIPQRQTAPIWNISQYNQTVTSSSLATTGGGIVSIFSIPPAVTQLTNGITPLSSLSSYADFRPSNFNDELNNIVNVLPLKKYNIEINSNASTWSFLNTFNTYNPVQSTATDPLLNNKKLMNKLLLDAFIDPANPVALGTTSGGNVLAASSLIGSVHLQGVLGLALFRKAFNSFQLNLSDEQVQEATHQLILLTSTLLTKNSTDAALPAIGALATSLPPDSPALAILYSLSLIKQINSSTLITQASVATLIKKIPSLASLTPDQIKQLTSIVNLSQSLVSIKLLGDHLGLNGLTAQFLPTISFEASPTSLKEVFTDPLITLSSFNLDKLNTDSHLSFNSFNNSASLLQSSDQGKENAALAARVSRSFSDQGKGEDESNFLGQTASDLVSRGTNTPTVHTVTAQTIDQEILVNSIKASLLLNEKQKFNLNQADQIAHEALAQTLSKNYSSPSLFRAALTAQLQEAGREDEAVEVASHAFLISKQTVNLNQQPLAVKTVASLINQQLDNLLKPSLGSQATDHVKKDLLLAIYGTPNPDSSDLADVKSPTSVVNSIKDQVDNLKVSQDREYAKALHLTFKDTIKNTEDFYSFSLKLMDPAYLYVYSSNEGLMYAGNQPSNWKQSIDIKV